MRTSIWFFGSAAALSLCLLGPGPSPLLAQAPNTPTPAALDPLRWPEAQRAFFQDGPGLLLGKERRAALAAEDEASREAAIHQFLDRDPLPETADNELEVGIDRRQRLAEADYLSPRDVRAQLVFLNGRPAERVVIDCGVAFKPMEIWTYHGDAGSADEQGSRPQGRVIIYRPAAGEPWKAWERGESKELLYTPEMTYWLQQWEELGGWGIAKRFDLQVCKQADLIDKVTGVPGLTGGARRRREKKEGILQPVSKDYDIRPGTAGPAAEGFLDPPRDLALWAREAAATPMPATPAGSKPLEVGGIEVQFPDRAGQRILTRMLLRVNVPKESAVAPEDGGAPQVTLVVDGVVESEGRAFDDFRLRFRTPPRDGLVDVAVDQPLRPERAFVIRLRIHDEATGAEARVARGFVVPAEPVAPTIARPAALADAETVTGTAPADVPGSLASGADTVTLLPPEGDISLGLWRAEALTTGKRIAKVVFLVDGQQQLVRSRAPFTAELRLSKYPTEQVVRVEGYDEAGKLLASDQVVLNQPRGALRVTVLEPIRGAKVNGRVNARAEVSIPEEKRLAAVEFRVNDKLIATLTQPPWQTPIDVPANEEIVYLAVTARLEDGATAEDVRFLRAPEYLEQVDVDLVELYVTVTDRAGNLARGLAQEDFEVTEGNEKQEIAKFELVENLPLTVGIALDTSGSMEHSIGEAERAAVEFLHTVVNSPKDRCFALTFSGRPVLRMPLSDDAEAAARSLEGLQAVGATALHDAIVHSLYYFRGIHGQKALILLSDGDDTSSDITFNDALEYARRSGVAVYAVGLNVGMTDFGVRKKLDQLTSETGGEVFYVGKASELSGIYKQIEQELRSRYLIAFNARRSAGTEGYRQVDVKVLKKGLKARTARGYYP